MRPGFVSLPENGAHVGIHASLLPRAADSESLATIRQRALLRCEGLLLAEHEERVRERLVWRDEVERHTGSSSAAPPLYSDTRDLIGVCRLIPGSRRLQTSDLSWRQIPVLRGPQTETNALSHCRARRAVLASD